MKRLSKFIGIMLALVVSFSFVVNSASAKSIYFPGEYKCGNIKVDMSGYTGKDNYKKGEECGTVTIKDGKEWNFVLIKTGANAYKTNSKLWLDKNGNSFKGYLKITVKKKSISIKASNKKMKNKFSSWIKTYKLKYHFYS